MVLSCITCVVIWICFSLCVDALLDFADCLCVLLLFLPIDFLVCKMKRCAVCEWRYITDVVLKRFVAIQNQKGIDLSWFESS